MNERIEFKVEDQDYYVVLPSARQERDAAIIFAKNLTQFIRDGIISADKLEKYFYEQGIWDDEKQAKRIALETAIAKGVDTLEKGGIKKSEARSIAIECRKKRFELLQLLIDRTKLESFTAEALADKDRTAYFISCCTKKSDGTRAFSSLEDYQDKENSTLGNLAAYNFSRLYYGYTEDFDKKFPESQFLMKYGFADENMRLVNADGQFVDTDGNVIKEPEKIEFQEFLEG